MAIIPIPSGMFDCEHQLLADYPNWGLLLEAYALLQAEEPLTLTEPEPAPEAEADAATHHSATRWFARIAHVSGIETKHLSPIHGRMIALGWLRFQLEDSQLGVQYRLSPEGRKALTTYAPAAPELSATGG